MIGALKSIEPIGFLSFAPASAGTNRADVDRRIIQNCPYGRGAAARAVCLFGSGSAGLGHLVQSWIGVGPNQAVSPQQLQTVFGEDQVQTMSR